MITLAVVTAVVLLAIGLVVAVALDPGPPPSDVAVAYEQALDRRDGLTMWNLSAPMLRGDGSKRDFVETVRRMPPSRPEGALRSVTVEDEFVGTADASVLTRVERRDGTAVVRRTRCTKHQGAWRVQTVNDHVDGDGPPAAGSDASTPS